MCPSCPSKPFSALKPSNHAGSSLGHSLGQAWDTKADVSQQKAWDNRDNRDSWDSWDSWDT